MKTFLYYFWIFYITSFLGFIIETIWCLLKNKRLESRKGVIYEFLIPIYGATGVLLVFFVGLFKLKKLYKIFIAGFLISTIIEFVSSFLQEKIFATKSWDYKDFAFNLCGRVNLLYAIMFGLVALLSYQFVLLPITNLFMSLEINKFIIILSFCVLLFMLFDFVISFIAVYRMKERKRKIKREGKFWAFIDKKYNNEYLKKVYANMEDVTN